MTASIDHVYILVNSLSQSSQAFENLGFRCSDRGVHSGLGTANKLIMFADDYFELLAVEEENDYNLPFQEFLANREGWVGVALATDAARDVFQDLKKTDIQGLKFSEISRPVDRDGKIEHAGFSLINFGREKWPELNFFYCQHHRRDLVWHRAKMDHPNGVVGLGRCYVVVDDPFEQAQKYRKYLKAEIIDCCDGRSVVSFGQQKIELLSEDAFKRLNPSEEEGGNKQLPVSGIGFWVSSLQQTKDYFDQHKVSYIEREKYGVMGLDCVTHGVTLSFQQQE